MGIFLWLGFILFVLIMLALDLGVFNRKAHVISTKEALRWTGLCIVLALIFNGFLYFAYERHLFGIGRDIGHTTGGKEAAANFFQGYVLEMSLSLDNIFVIALIFAYFGVPRLYQHRVLFWGILGALVMRGVMIAIGATLIRRFSWVIYVFGALLVFTAFKMLFAGEGKVEPDRNPLVRLARRLYPVTSHFEGEKFFVRVNGRRAMTPMFAALLVVESTDVLFAIDSIPAIFGITQDPFLVFTSNVFAILCLRSMYFALSGMIAYFYYLKYSLVALLFYIGVKMLISGIAHIPAMLSLGIILLLLSMGIIASLFHKPPACAEPSSSQPADEVGL
ncbi:MAG: membrane protein [Phycisphaerae bacterium]